MQRPRELRYENLILYNVTILYFPTLLIKVSFVLNMNKGL